jgi:mono/diheme cytochrome c family protein
MRTTFLLTLLTFGFVCVAGVAVAADPVPPGKPVIDATVPPNLPARATIDWEKMNESQKKKYMKATVLPEMKKLFVGFDKKYKSMTCLTCHGSKAVENKFKMPGGELPKLPAPTDRPGFMALQQKKPEAVKFMGTQVKPAMAALLNLPEWSPTNPKGFGCYGCHTPEGAPAPVAAPPAAKAAGGGW